MIHLNYCSKRTRIHVLFSNSTLLIIYLFISTLTSCIQHKNYAWNEKVEVVENLFTYESKIIKKGTLFSKSYYLGGKNFEKIRSNNNHFDIEIDIANGRIKSVRYYYNRILDEVRKTTSEGLEYIRDKEMYFEFKDGRFNSFINGIKTNGFTKGYYIGDTFIKHGEFKLFDDIGQLKDAGIYEHGTLIFPPS